MVMVTGAGSLAMREREAVGREAVGLEAVVVVRPFIEANCAGCHNGTTKKGGLDLTSLPADYADPTVFATWVRVHDRVWEGEMPPRSAPQPDEAARGSFLGELSRQLLIVDRQRIRREGRAVWRRMNREEYENTLRDLLDASWLQIRDLLPEDGQVARSNKVGTALDVSHVQINRYLGAAEHALREVLAQDDHRPETVTKRYYAREQRAFTGKVEFSQFNRSSERATFPLVGNSADVPVLRQEAPMTRGAADPERRELEGMGVVASSYEPLEIRFNNFKAPMPGRYRLRMMAHSFWAGPESGEKWWHPSREVASAGRTVEPVTLYAEIPPRQMRLLGTVDVTPEPAVVELEVELLKDETIRPDAVRLFRSRPPNWRNPLAVKGGQPGVSFRWLEVTGPLIDQWPGRGHRLLFGDLPLKKNAKGRIEVVTSNPRGDAERLLRNFMTRAYRRPLATPDEDLPRFLSLVDTALRNGESFIDAMISAYSAVLCSPAFVTMEERPGRLDDHALATRLSYFLWNSEPDGELRELARQGTLHRPATLNAESERMLRDPRSERFINAFLDYWLDLRKVNNTSPDEFLYNDYYLDDFLTESAAAESYRFFGELVRHDLPASNIVASDFVMINERLAEHYGLAGVYGSAIRRVALPADSVRGGLLTQASLLKVTANGTTTSPVIRGAWVMDRILGKPAPPPPPSIPAVEPDTRGATTIREQLDKHRNLPSCNACHAKIDPAGFALENFDVFGAWRDQYRALTAASEAASRATGIGKNGQRFAFRYAQPIDGSGTLPDGRSFRDIRELKRLLVTDQRQIARNLTARLIVFATGAPIQFSDRPKIEAILDRAAPKNYGVRTLIGLIIASDIFQNK